MQFKAGSLVKVRHRDWVVLPSPDDDLVLLKPLGGSEEEITGIYLPLAFEEDRIESTNFPQPAAADIGDIASARILYNATRLSFRNGAGPFRCLGKLSFRARSYQMVPLIMALRQKNPVRLLIADDVGVGKTIEALLILKELLERREIKRFAVIALPHLCEQWQAELKDKFGIEAVIIRSNTQARLDRDIQGDTSVYEYYPYQVISIDYIKADHRKPVFVNECPEFVIVDEAHTCSWAGGVESVQQQRYALIKELSRKPDQHLVLLTATPHSGKQAQFSSLLGLIKDDYADLDIPNAAPKERQDLAKYYVQRRRADVERWMQEDTPFPKREAGEFQYDLSPSYAVFYDQMLRFALGLTQTRETHEGKKKIRYWTALGLLRGAMSSPAAGMEMLRNRIQKLDNQPELDLDTVNPIMDEDYGSEKDFMPTHILDKNEWSSAEARQLGDLARSLEQLQGLEKDTKVATTLEIVRQWVVNGYCPVIFCRFIATANYVGEILKSELFKIDKAIDVQVVTSEDPDEVRKARIEEMGNAKKRVLIATDCLSEGINLQEHFTAVLHYDLPWNPNRLEQREGRIDRFGQPADKVKAYLLYGNDNPIDGIVLKVLLRKVREIRKSTGISIPFPEDSQSLMDAVMQSVLVTANRQHSHQQLAMDFGEFETVKQKEIVATHAIEKAAEREQATRSIFAQHAIKASEIETDLQQSDESIGDPRAVEAFVVEVLTRLLGVQITADKKRGFQLYTINLPVALKTTLPENTVLKVSFFSPTPEGYLYLGRNHPFVEQLCQLMLAQALNHEDAKAPARAAVIKSRDVQLKTTLLLLRVRNVIEEKKGDNQLVAEEMLLWGYEGSAGSGRVLSLAEVKRLMNEAIPSANISEEAKADWLDREIGDMVKIADSLDQVAVKRAEILVEAHERFRKVLGGSRYKVVEPVLPMDLMGVYILLPDQD